MSKHLTVDRMMELVDGTTTAAEREHAASCAACAERADEVAKGLALAREAEMPEPSPLYWEAFRRQVSRRLEERAPGAWWWRLGPVVAAAALVVIVPLLKAPEPRSTPLAPWSALPEEDPGLAVLAGVASTGVELAPEAALAEYLVELSEEDSQALAQALRAKIEEGRS